MLVGTFLNCSSLSFVIDLGQIVEQLHKRYVAVSETLKPPAHFYGLQSLNLSMLLLSLPRLLFFKKRGSVRPINSQGGVEGITSDRRHLIRAQDSEKPPGTKAL